MQVGLIVIDESPVDALRVVRAAEAAGVHSVWTIDYYNRDSLARSAAFAAATERITIGTSVTPLFARAALALATGAADVQAVAEGRFVLGVGSSTRRMNHDWFGVSMDHPAPQAAERIDLVRKLIRHRDGPFRFSGKFEEVSFAHLDRRALPSEVPILAAGVGDHMLTVAGSHGDGFVGHPIASVDYLTTRAQPRLQAALRRKQRDPATFLMTTQVIASVGESHAAAMRAAALQVGFYATVKGYDPLFLDNVFAQERSAVREAFARSDLAALAKSATPMVNERSVYGSPESVAAQLRRYEGVTDWALLYPPHFGVNAEAVTWNEMRLIEVAASWGS